MARALKVCIPYCLGNAMTISSSLLPEHFLQITNQIDVMYEPNMCTNVIMICGNQNQVVYKSNFLESIYWLRKYAPPCTPTHSWQGHAMVNIKREILILMGFGLNICTHGELFMCNKIHGILHLCLCIIWNFEHMWFHHFLKTLTKFAIKLMFMISSFGQFCISLKPWCKVPRSSICLMTNT